jgi:hypothetical protein
MLHEFWLKVHCVGACGGSSVHLYQYSYHQCPISYHQCPISYHQIPIHISHQKWDNRPFLEHTIYMPHLQWIHTSFRTYPASMDTESSIPRDKAPGP